MTSDEILLDFLGRHLPTFERNVTTSYRHQQKALYALGISLEGALNFIYSALPTASEFLDWVHAHARPQKSFDPEEIDEVLSQQDLDFWNENGYIVLKGVIPSVLCEAARAAIWEYIGASPEDVNSWYKPIEEARGMMLKLWDHPVLDEIRNSPQIFKAYCQLYGHAEIYKVIDKVSFNPPVHANYHFLGSSLHWDTSLHLPIANEFQGLLYLTNTAATDGAFHCVPGFHRSIGEWMAALPEGSDPRAEALNRLEAIPVPGEAGDFVIWHQALPHCATENRGKTPRMVQYLTYFSDDVEESEIWI